MYYNKVKSKDNGIESKNRKVYKKMKKSSAFTLAEVLITLAIIGVVAAMTIPGVILRTNQQEYKSGFKKAISVLNQAVTMNLAIDNDSPEYQKNAQELHDYLIKRMNVMRSDITAGSNKAFYTADGFRYEIGTVPAEGCSQEVPCIISVDVNGDRGPTTVDDKTYITSNYPTAADTEVPDCFAVMVTDVSVQPYGAVAQRTMYQADSN